MAAESNHTIFAHAAYRQRARNYGGIADLHGYAVLVVNVDGSVISLVTHNLNRIEYLELNLEDFVKLYFPDFSCSPKQMAGEFRNLTSFITPSPQAVGGITKIYNSQESDMEIAVVKPKKKRASSKANVKAQEIIVCADIQRRTCLKISDDGAAVKYIPLLAEGFSACQMGSEEFKKAFEPLEYPLEKAAKLYVEYAVNLGATKEVLDILGSIVKITEKEHLMATSKNAARAAKAAATAKANAKAPAKKAAAKTAKPAKATKTTKTATEPAKAAKSAKPVAAKKTAPVAKGPSAASRFKELIMEGKKTDQQIFETVQKEFNLDDNKRSYVGWYRNNLVKSGENPPAAK